MDLKSLRNKKHLSQEQLAISSGLNVRTIQRIENGSTPSIESLKCLASVLEVEPGDITQTSDQPTPVKTISHSESVVVLLSVASLFILFAAKSESVIPNIGAFFYVCAAICFVWVSVKIIKQRHGRIDKPNN